METINKREAWNKGKLVGQKPPLKPKDIWAIRIHLQNAHAVRDLAMFNLAIDSKLRGCDLVSLRVRDITCEAFGEVGRSPTVVLGELHNAYARLPESIRRTGAWQGEIWGRRKNGEIYPKWLSISTVVGTDGQISHYIGTHSDITERKKAEDRINALAFFDQLTGLPNRTLLLDRLKKMQFSSGRNNSHNALMFIDLDNFKTLNDNFEQQGKSEVPPNLVPRAF
jgi:predicted signal transduction protein with EAL and GGDEF domain